MWLRPKTSWCILTLTSDCRVDISKRAPSVWVGPTLYLPVLWCPLVPAQNNARQASVNGRQHVLHASVMCMDPLYTSKQTSNNLHRVLKTTVHGYTCSTTNFKFHSAYSTGGREPCYSTSFGACLMVQWWCRMDIVLLLKDKAPYVYERYSTLSMRSIM